MSIKLHQIAQHTSLELLARQMVEGFITGMHKSPYHGFSVEFAEHRLYNEGESTRHIDWKVYARTDRYYVKKFEEETNLDCHVMLDVSAPASRTTRMSNPSPTMSGRRGQAEASSL